ncbi:hypothetical protein VZT92_011516 [Zoarces viviparus]|uniref:Uncharacterized protein n=1 Tax=Zoarces viviparus TaxID=48416 RepID=A0AAW1F5Z0_ZOAVI
MPQGVSPNPTQSATTNEHRSHKTTQPLKALQSLKAALRAKPAETTCNTSRAQLFKLLPSEPFTENSRKPPNPANKPTRNRDQTIECNCI